MNELDMAIKCISKHANAIIEEHNRWIKDIYVTEENRETIRGKYFNLAYVIHVLSCDEIGNILIEHCYNNHV